MMTEVREQKMRRFFNIYDAQQTGSIGKVNFEQPVQIGASMLGYAPGSAEYEEMHKWSMGFWHYLKNHLQKSDDSQVQLDEFIKAMDALASDKKTLNEIIMGHASFTIKLWDRDGDGMMDEEEFVAAHTAYNTKESAAREAFSHLDRNGDKLLSYSEIIQAVEEYFVSDDPNAIGNWFIMDPDQAGVSAD